MLTPDTVPENFRVDQITVPMYLHYSKNDPIADIKDVKRLIPMLNGTEALHLQRIDDFNHLDFILSVNAYKTIYPKILKFFAKCTDKKS